jgi:signal transduction histidine kinase
VHKHDTCIFHVNSISIKHDFCFTCHQVITLTFPDEKGMKTFQLLKVIIICLAGVMIFGVALFTLFMLHHLKRSKIQEAILQAELIEQKEAVKQAERKSMNKSMAVARASHDVRNALHSIIGLIDYCQDQRPGSDLGTDLAKMKEYASDLLGWFKCLFLLDSWNWYCPVQVK